MSSVGSSPRFGNKRGSSLILRRPRSIAAAKLSLSPLARLMKYRIGDSYNFLLRILEKILPEALTLGARERTLFGRILVSTGKPEV